MGDGKVEMGWTRVCTFHPSLPFKQDTGAGEVSFCGLHANGYYKHKDREGDMNQVSTY